MPFEAKTKGQRIVHFLTSLAGLSPGTAAQKTHKALKGEAYSSALQAGGANEAVSDLIGGALAQFDFPSLETRAPKSSPTPIEENARDSAKKTYGEDLPPPDEGGPFFEALVPEHELLERLEPMLNEELKKKIGSPPPIVPLEVQAKAPLKPQLSAFDLQQEVGKKIAPSSIPNRTKAAQSLHREINRLSEADYGRVNKAYDRSKELNQNVSDIRPQMVHQLEELVEEINAIPEPSRVQKDIRSIAKKILHRSYREREGFLEVGNDALISQIQSNNQKIKHDYQQGQPTNAYLHLNSILENSIEEVAKKNPKALEAWNSARQQYREWAQTFKSDELLPWRNPSLVNYSNLLKKIETPDQLRALEPVLNRTPQGKELFSRIQRDYVESKLEPFFKDPNKVGNLDFDKTMKELGVALEPSQRHAIENDLFHAKDQLLSHERAERAYKIATEGHKAQIQSQKQKLQEWKDEARKISASFPYKTDSSILKELQSVRGLKRLESFLPRTEEGVKLMNEIKDYAAVNLLTQGKINPAAEAAPLKKIFNDVDQRALLEHTLGKKLTNDLHSIIKRAPEIDKKLSRMHQGLKFAKTGAKLIPGLRSQIALGEAMYDIWRMIKPAINKGEYGMVDLEAIRFLIEHRKDLLN